MSLRQSSARSTKRHSPDPIGNQGDEDGPASPGRLRVQHQYPRWASLRSLARLDRRPASSLQRDLYPCLALRHGREPPCPPPVRGRTARTRGTLRDQSIGDSNPQRRPTFVICRCPGISDVRARRRACDRRPGQPDRSGLPCGGADAGNRAESSDRSIGELHPGRDGARRSSRGGLQAAVTERPLVFDGRHSG